MSNSAIKMTPMTLEDTVKAYETLKKDIERLKGELETHKLILENAANDSDDNTIIIGEYKVRLSEASRENFNVKQAREELGNHILRPFTTTISYTRLTVKKAAA